MPTTSSPSDQPESDADNRFEDVWNGSDSSNTNISMEVNVDQESDADPQSETNMTSPSSDPNDHPFSNESDPTSEEDTNNANATTSDEDAASDDGFDDLIDPTLNGKPPEQKPTSPSATSESQSTTSPKQQSNSTTQATISDTRNQTGVSPDSFTIPDPSVTDDDRDSFDVLISPFPKILGFLKVCFNFFLGAIALMLYVIGMGVQLLTQAFLVIMMLSGVFLALGALFAIIGVSLVESPFRTLGLAIIAAFGVGFVGVAISESFKYASKLVRGKMI